MDCINAYFYYSMTQDPKRKIKAFTREDHDALIEYGFDITWDAPIDPPKVAT